MISFHKERRVKHKNLYKQNYVYGRQNAGIPQRAG